MGEEYRVQRYAGIGIEDEFGQKVDADIHVDIVSSDLDTPGDTQLVYEGGLSRGDADHRPGPYVPEGGLEYAFDVNTIGYILYLVLGNVTEKVSQTEDNAEIVYDDLETASITDIENEDEMKIAYLDGDGNEQEITVVFDGTEDILGDIITKINDAADPDTIAADDAGNLVLTAPAAGGGSFIEVYSVDTRVQDVGITAKVNRVYGDYKTSFAPLRNDLILPSATFRIGKDNFEHFFQGGTVSQITLALDDEFAMVDLDIISQKDGKAELISIENLQLPDAYPLAFHELKIEMGKRGEEQVQRTDIESIEITINNNADGGEGVIIGSRYPQRVFSGDLEITASVDISFKDTSDIERFWGDEDGPSDVGTEEQNITFTFDGGLYGQLRINLPECIIEDIDTTPSGRDRLVQSAEIRAFYDEDAEGELIATLENNEDYDFAD